MVGGEVGVSEQVSDSADRPKKRRGRPPKGEGPVPYKELDRLLVFGEMTQGTDGRPSVRYPSYRELAERFGVANSLIATYAKKHNVQNRRKLAEANIERDATNKLAELRANIEAFTRDDELRVIDRYLEGFDAALKDGRVCFTSPTDLDKMLRLKHFLQGGADSRQEVRGELGLADLQERYRRSREEVDAFEAGIVDTSGETVPPPEDFSGTADHEVITPAVDADTGANASDVEAER